MRALLDVNVLIALIDELHVHHAAATHWLTLHRASGWASCPLTENGCIRVVSSPGYTSPRPARQVADMLALGAGNGDHEYWADSVSLVRDPALRWDRVLSSRQLTDCYLLALAVAHAGRLVTFDHSIPRSAVPAATAAQLVVIGGARVP